MAAEATQDTETWRVKPEDFGEGFDPVLEVFESMNGSLWFITEEPSSGRAFGYARLAGMERFAEWGTIDYAELERNPKVWRVGRENWSNINTYEEGLLVRE